MTYLESNFEENIEVPDLGDDASLPAIVKHIAVTNRALELCEKMIQHMAMGDFSDEFDKYMCQHVRLIAQRNRLVTMLRVAEAAGQTIKEAESFKLALVPQSIKVVRRFYDWTIDLSKKWELWSVDFCLAATLLLYFAYDWSNHSYYVAFFALTSQSFWELMKITFWPMFVFALLEWLIWGRKSEKFFYATALKMIISATVVFMLQYSWMAMYQPAQKWSIVTLITALVLGHLFSYSVYESNKNFHFEKVSIIAVVVLLFMYVLFDFFPPNSILTQDQVGGSYPSAYK